jgi:phosphoglycolate phosphatase
MIRGVVFDFDGTLVVSNQIKRNAFLELAGGFPNGRALMDVILCEAENRDRYWIFDAFARRLQDGVDAFRLAERYTGICEERIAAAPEVAGARACLEHLLGTGKKLFLNSATPAGPLAVLARLRRLDDLFEGIYGAPAKKLENLAAIRAHYGYAPEELLVVGDGESDRLSAEMAGSHFVAIENDQNDFIEKPTSSIPDMTRLPEIVAYMCSRR